MASYDDTATVSGSVVSIENGADEVGAKSCVVTVSPTLSGKSEVTETQTGRNLLDTANAETKSHNSVSITCDGNGKYTATGTATGGSANITFALKTPCTIKNGMYLHLMNASANASVSVTLQKQDNTTIYAPALSPANRIADLSSYAGQTIYSIRFYVVNGASFEMTLTPMLCFSSTATTFEPYTAPTTYTASLGRTIYGGTADIVNGEGTDENGNDFTFTGQEIPTRLGYNAFWSEQGDTELTYYKSGYGFTSVTVNKNGVSQTAKLHKVIYGGKADVIRGTCEPKNLFVKDNPNEVDGYFTTTGFSTGNANAKTVYIPIVGGETYTVSKTAGQRFQIATAEVIPSNGASFTGRQANNTATSLTITASANDKYLWAWVFLDGTDTGTLADMLDSVQIEKGSSATEYVPGFTPFTFPPISISTDEGENNLFANEGASAITYRKAVD